jgi:hypothetical protein
MTQTFGTETAKQGFHFVGGHSLHQTCLDFIPTLRLVIEPQFLEGGFRLGLDARQGIADLMISEQRSTMTMLHDMG